MLCGSICLSRYVADNIEVMRAGLDGGQIPPRATLEGVADTLRPHIVETSHKVSCSSRSSNFLGRLTLRSTQID